MGCMTSLRPFSKDSRHIADDLLLSGIIDMLQEWDIWKQLERYFKIMFRLHCADKDELSALEPQAYQERFLSFVKDVVLDLQEGPERGEV